MAWLSTSWHIWMLVAVGEEASPVSPYIRPRSHPRTTAAHDECSVCLFFLILCPFFSSVCFLMCVLLFLKVWMDGVVPGEWKKAVVLPLYKSKGERCEFKTVTGRVHMWSSSPSAFLLCSFLPLRCLCQKFHKLSRWMSIPELNSLLKQWISLSKIKISSREAEQGRNRYWSWFYESFPELIALLRRWVFLSKRKHPFKKLDKLEIGTEVDFINVFPIVKPVNVSLKP